MKNVYDKKATNNSGITKIFFFLKAQSTFRVCIEYSVSWFYSKINYGLKMLL